MRRTTLIVIVVAGSVLTALGAILVLAGGAPVPAASNGSMDISSREYGGALVALLVLGFIVLGADWQDWL